MHKHQIEDPGEVPSNLEQAETVFDVKDIVNLYEKYARFDERIKNFCEKVTEAIQTGDHHDLLYSF